jgi:hypothetical protein
MHCTGFTIWLFRLALATCLGCAAWDATLRADEPDSQAEKSWEGTWKNNKYKTTGPLKCVARPKDDKQWEATFSGKFINSPFEYTITFASAPQRDRTLIGGKAELDGDGYEWTGYIRGRTLYGQFRSLKGHNGEFVLQQSK